MSVQKAAASAFALAQETNFSLANTRFDFSLVKVDVPAEFQGLGKELTSTRKKAAEEGSPHVTARKLGALFQKQLSATPTLLRTYGIRVSEIASNRDVNPTAKKMHGFFADHVGIDGTSIWAAATSGPEAIYVHLLACMLARIWPAPEAVSIWVELVAQQKNILASTDEVDPGYFQSVETSRVTVAREALAEWDASARAWLRAADQAMGVKQKQLMLILNNVNVPVNKKPSVYSSVLDAWTSSMDAVDKLISGTPQSTQDGAVLLGLAAWHIYPDMLVLGDSQANVAMHDDLVARGAVLTIGLELKSQNQTGVYWSLPLSHLRYYGRPVIAKRSLEDQANRLTVDQVILVALGSITKTWGMEASDIAHGLISLWEYIAKEATQFCALGTPHWLGLFAQATSDILETDNLVQKKTAAQLMRFGCKRAANFAIPEGTQQAISPMFGLYTFKNFFSFLTLQGKIDILRNLAKQYRGHQRVTFLIRYRVGTVAWEFATAIPIARQASKRTAAGETSKGFGHVRWVQYIDETVSSTLAGLG